MDGVLDSVVLRDTSDLGYLTVCAAQGVFTGTLKPGATTFAAGCLCAVTVAEDNVLLDVPFTFTKDNVGRFNF